MYSSVFYRNSEIKLCKRLSIEENTAKPFLQTFAQINKLDVFLLASNAVNDKIV